MNQAINVTTVSVRVITVIVLMKFAIEFLLSFFPGASFFIYFIDFISSAFSARLQVPNLILLILCNSRLEAHNVTKLKENTIPRVKDVTA